jgi:hypothetical protein
MDGFTEKKWFVYLGDHHEGPFALDEIQSKISDGQLTVTNYVWAEGMDDWKMMNEVQAFESINQTRAQPILQSPALEEPPPILENEAAPEAVAAMVAEPVITLQPALDAVAAGSGGASAAIHLEAASLLTNGGSSKTASTESKSKTKSSHRAGQLMKWGATIAVMGGLGVAYMGGYFAPLLSSSTVRTGAQTIGNVIDPVLMGLADRVPFLSKWISPIPQLEDVAPDEYALLKAAAATRLDDSGPVLAVAMSRSDPFSPVFYVSSNLPEGAMFDIYIEGISETLLNQLSFTAKGQVLLHKRWGKTATIKGIDGRAFPRGQYTLYIVDPDTQPASVKPLMSQLPNVVPQVASNTVPKGLKIVATKTYFLGGARDATYTTRLKEFHDKLMAKAQAELTECKQFAMTVEMQLNGTNAKFTALRRGRRVTPAQKKAWVAFHTQWTQLLGQLDQSFAKLTPESLKNDYFYGSLYQASQTATQAVEKLHELQSSYFASPSDPKSFEIQMGEATSIAQAAVNELKAKIDHIEKLPPNPNGMPSRDGA